MAPAETVALTAPNGVKIDLPTGLFINNEFVKSSAGAKISSINPRCVIVHVTSHGVLFNESEITSVEAASPDDIDTAVKAARAAFESPEWRDLPGTDRGELLYRFATLIDEHKETLATLEAWDNGKAYSVALNEDVGEVIKTLKYYAGWADKIHGQTIPTTPQKFAYTLKQPIGVCGQIIPWNFPLAMAAWKIGPAIACGNTVVLKPAEQTPLSALYLATLIPKAGFPPGVINIAASQTMKTITLETGGKSPLVVFKDADLEQAVKWGHLGIMYNQGQVCTATSRILVHEDIHDEYLRLFKEEVLKNKVGDPFHDDTFQGPQVTKAQYERVLGYIETGKSEGAKLESGGVPHKNVGDGKGFFIEPTVFSGVKEDMRIFQEEVFGPFVTIITFKTEEEAIRVANNSSYGLGAALFTTDVERAHRVAGRLEAGMVWVNSSNDSDFRVPFGGVKQSGIGRELGEAGLAAYTQIKAVHINMGTKL
uniref:aldehyde dehydrogenase (NAD(+)) n=1 Tax=Bionectria ochroleuca TaxID=29856 RepID=A0A0B7KI33_BIOOC